MKQWKRAETDTRAMAELRAKLLPEDRDHYDRDVTRFGSAVVEVLSDGRVVYVPPAAWPKDFIGS